VCVVVVMSKYRGVPYYARYAGCYAIFCRFFLRLSVANRDLIKRPRGRRKNNPTDCDGLRIGSSAKINRCLF
jgi:hypothetical protein